MSKKWILSWIVFSVCASLGLGASGVALAAGNSADQSIILPEGFNPRLVERRVSGRVLGVDLQAGTFSLHTRLGDDLTITVNEETLFPGAVKSLEALKTGAAARVGLKKIVCLLQIG